MRRGEREYAYVYFLRLREILCVFKNMDYINTTTMEICMEVPQKTMNGTAI